MVDRELPLLTQIGVGGGKTRAWWKEPAGWRTWRSENATSVAAVKGRVVCVKAEKPTNRLFDSRSLPIPPP